MRRLIDADAYSAEMKERQEAAWKWRNEAIAEEDEVKLARAEGAFTAFTEAKLTMDKHIINPWHRVEERLPDDSREVIIFTVSRIIGVGSFIRPNWYQWYSGGGLPVDVTHWMPLPEPPKEE